MIHTDHILPSMSWSFKWSLSFELSHQNPLHYSLFSHVCHMCPTHLILLDFTFLPKDKK
jgi:hypothetical protein